MEEEAQRLAQAMIPLIEASQNSNGLPPRRLHNDDDLVNNISETIERDLDGKMADASREDSSAPSLTGDEHLANSNH